MQGLAWLLSQGRDSDLTFSVTGRRHPGDMATFLYSRRLPRRPSSLPSGRVQFVQLVEGAANLAAVWDRIGVVEDVAGDEVEVRYGELVIQVPAEWVVPVEEG